MQSQSPTVLLYLYTVLGAAMLWTKSALQKKHYNSFGDVLEHVFVSKRLRYIAQFLIFVFFGALVGMVMVHPFTESHALAAGMAWSRLAARD